MTNSHDSQKPIDPLAKLQEWYSEQCNGDWEHSYGVTIETLDNPGWIVTIDLSETEWQDLSVPRLITERTEIDWVQIEVSDKKFLGCGGPGNLLEILTSFLQLL